MWHIAYILKPGEAWSVTFGLWMFLELRELCVNAAFYFPSRACLRSKRSSTVVGDWLKEPTVGKESILGNWGPQRGTRGGGTGLSSPKHIGEMQISGTEFNHPQYVYFRWESTLPILFSLYAFIVAEIVILGSLYLLFRVLLVALASLACLAPLDFLEWKVTG